MAKAKAKTIQLLLDGGDLKGVISMEDSSWYAGKFYSAPRDAVDDLIQKDGCKNYGVYLLLSDDKVYVGQASDLSRRISQHKIGKLWWDRVVVFTTKDDSLNKADIDFLEATLIEKADKVGRLDSDNKNKGNKKKVDEFREVVLEQYLDEALFLLELIGINVFSNERRKARRATTTIETGDGKITPNMREIRAKREAIQFLKDKGIEVGKNVTYARIQEQRMEYWANPKVELLNKDWDIILNNQKYGTIHYIHVPQGAFTMREKEKNGLYHRHDKPELIDLNIIDESFTERRSKLDFKKYKITSIVYGE